MLISQGIAVNAVPTGPTKEARVRGDVERDTAMHEHISSFLMPPGMRFCSSNNKESIDSVAYIHFKRHDSVAKFAAAFQGHAFRNSKGAAH